MEAALNSSLGRTILGPVPFRIGRAPDNTLAIADSQSSSHHVEVAPDPGGNSYQITDLSSTNGTYVNEQRLVPNVPRVLNSGDVIRIGTTNFTYESSSGSVPTAPANPSDNYEATILASPGSFAPPDQPGYQSPASENYNAPAQFPPYTPYPPQGGYPQPQQGYPPPQQGYSPPQQGYSQPQPGYPPPQQGYLPPQGSYPQPQPGYPPPQGNYPPPQGNYAPPQFVQPKKKRRVGCWIAAIIVLLLLIGGFGVTYLATRSTPQKTLQTYCNAIKSGDYQTAYNQYSARVQSKESESTFASGVKLSTSLLGGMTNCVVNSVTEDSNTTARGTITYTFGDGKLIPDSGNLVLENGTWKLDASSNESGTTI